MHMLSEKDMNKDKRRIIDNIDDNITIWTKYGINSKEEITTLQKFMSNT